MQTPECAKFKRTLHAIGGNLCIRDQGERDLFTDLHFGVQLPVEQRARSVQSRRHRLPVLHVQEICDQAGRRALDLRVTIDQRVTAPGEIDGGDISKVAARSQIQ